MEGFELRLLDEGSLVGCHESRIFQTLAGHLCDFCELGIPSLLVVGEFDFLHRVAVVGVARHADHALVASGRLSHVEHPKVSGWTKFVELGVIATWTSAPSFVSILARLQILYTAIEPVTPSKTVFPFNIVYLRLKF